MARPKKKNADYFPHDADMRNDPKVRALRRKFGATGFSVWVMLLETLTDSDYFELEYNELNRELLAGDFEVEPETLEEIITYCVDTLKLLNLDNGTLYSNRLKDRFENLLNRRLDDRKRKNKELSEEKTPKEEVFRAENPQSKVKESKVKESKVKSKKEILDKSLLSEVKTSDVPKELLEYFQIATTFQKLFIKNLNERNAPIKNQAAAKFEAYVTPIRLMLTDDGVTREQIRTAYEFLKSPEGDFWKANILSTKTLREKVQKLIAQKNAPKSLNYGKTEPTVNRQNASVIESNSRGWFNQ
jgi:hypothetical protein